MHLVFHLRLSRQALIVKLNARIEEIVEREKAMRAEIEEIIAQIEKNVLHPRSIFVSKED